MAKAGWYQRGNQARYYDGEAWTEHYRAVPPDPAPAPIADAPPVGPPLALDDHDGEARAKRRRMAAYVMLAGCGAVAVGCFLPWVKVTAPLIGTLTKSGVDNGGDGLIFLGLAAVLAIIAYQCRDGAGRAQKVATAVFVLIMAGLTAYELADLSARFADVDAEFVSTSYGSGLVLIGAGVVAAGVGWVQMATTPQ